MRRRRSAANLAALPSRRIRCAADLCESFTPAPARWLVQGHTRQRLPFGSPIR
jgi:hypothetical protein